MVIIDGDNEAGLKYNCQQFGLEVRTSLIPHAGRGVFLLRGAAKGTIVGYVFGIIRSSNRYHDIINDPSLAIGPEIEIVEDANNGILRAFTIETTVGDSYSILMSRQCPIGVMNDMKDKQKKSLPNVSVAQPSGWHNQPGVNKDLMHWNMFPVTLTVDLNAGAELYLDYGWSDASWKFALARMNKIVMSTQRREPATRVDFLAKQWANMRRWLELPHVKVMIAKFRYDIISGPMTKSQLKDLMYVALTPSLVLPGLTGLIIVKKIDRHM